MARRVDQSGLHVGDTVRYMGNVVKNKIGKLATIVGTKGEYGFYLKYENGMPGSATPEALELVRKGSLDAVDLKDDREAGSAPRSSEPLAPADPRVEASLTMANTLDRLIEHYHTSGTPPLGIRREYFRLVRGLRDLDRGEYTQEPSFLCGIQGMPKTEHPQYPSPGKANPGDIIIGVPVWFGDLDSAKLKVCVVGLEPRDTNSAFNIDRVGKKIFASPFGADRWNRETTIPRRPHIKYYEILQPFLMPAGVFLLLTDPVKEYAVVSDSSRENDRNARRQFRELSKKWRAFLVAEMDIIRPNRIIALGQAVYEAIVNAGLGRRYRVEIVRHPAQGGAVLAKEHIRRLARELGLPVGDSPIQGVEQEGQQLIAGGSPVPPRQTVQPKNLTRITSADVAATDPSSGGNMKPFAGPQDKYSLVASYIQQNHMGWTVRLPAKATQGNLLVTDSTTRRSVSLYVRFSQDKLQKHCEKYHIALGNHLMAMGWWAFQKRDLQNSRADFWVFVLPSLAEQKTSFTIIPPRELLQRLQPIRGHIEDRIDLYLFVTKKGRCWETRNLSRDFDRPIDNGTYSNEARDFSTFLNAWHLVAARLSNQLR